jgi:hypothetical protein
MLICFEITSGSATAAFADAPDEVCWFLEP